MPTTQSLIRVWLEEGKKRDATHVIVATDTYDYGDYPVFVLPGQNMPKSHIMNNRQPAEATR